MPVRNVGDILLLLMTLHQKLRYLRDCFDLTHQVTTHGTDPSTIGAPSFGQNRHWVVHIAIGCDIHVRYAKKPFYLHHGPSLRFVQLDLAQYAIDPISLNRYLITQYQSQAQGRVHTTQTSGAIESVGCHQREVKTVLMLDYSSIISHLKYAQYRPEFDRR